MAQTPEGKVKKLINKVLTERIQDGMYFNAPVPSGYGVPMLDYVGCYHGLFFAIEAKAPGKKPTPRQNLAIAQMRDAGGVVFVIDGPQGVEVLKGWLDAATIWHGRGLCHP